MNALQFARKIIEGPAGLDEFERKEVASFAGSDRVWASLWTLRCLANPECKGSAEALRAIMRRRRELRRAQAACRE